VGAPGCNGSMGLPLGTGRGNANSFIRAGNTRVGDGKHSFNMYVSFAQPKM